MMPTPAKPETITDQLNSFLRGELAAAESYRLALKQFQSADHASTLEECARSHERRAMLLRSAVVERGGQPATGSGVWGSLLRTLERSAASISEQAAIAVLVEGEDHARSDYLRDLVRLDGSAQTLVELSILPEQRKTHAAISAVRSALS